MRKVTIILAICFSTLGAIGCKKNTTSGVQENPQLIARLDSMLQAIGASSYVDLLTGKLEGNFSFSTHYGTSDANCASATIPFKINTQMSGIVSIDTAHKTTAINAGDLYINNVKISPDNVYFYYTVVAFTATSNMLDQLYGAQVVIKLIKDGVTVLQTNMYLPKNIVMKGINCKTGMFPDHSLKGGYTINWNIDYQNTNGVVIELLGKDVTGIERYSYILVRDNGSYTFTEDNLGMYPKERNPLGIDITLMRGNFAILRGTDNRRYNFNFVTTCGYLFRQ